MNTSLWQNFRFTRFLTSSTINNLGDWFDIFALQIIFVREFNASPTIMGLLAFFYFIPAILLGPLAGVVADRYSKRNIMIIADIISAGLTAGLFLSHNILIALLLILLRSAISSLNSPTQQAYVKQIIPAEHLLKASSYLAMSFPLAKILGPMLGAVILIFAPARTCLGINALSFIFSFLILFKLPIDKPIPTTIAQNKITGWLSDIKNGGLFVWRHYFLRILMILITIWYFSSSIYNAQLALFLKHIVPQNIHILGYMLGLEGLGAVLAGTILSRRKDIQNYAMYFFSTFFLVGAGTLGIALTPILLPQFFLYIAPFIRGIGSGIGIITLNYLIRKETSEKQIGCVFGINSSMQNLALAIGTLLSGVLILHFGAHKVYSGLAVLMFVTALCALSLLKKNNSTP